MNAGCVNAVAAPDRAEPVSFVDVRQHGVISEGWVAAFLVYSGQKREGVIEYEQATEYYKFVPIEAVLFGPPPGDFSIDDLKQRVIEWLASRRTLLMRC